MNKKISIIMLLSCVGNIFSMGDDNSKIYVSTADSAYSKAAALLASASCTVGGFKLLELPASQNALATAASILESSKAGSYAIVCAAGSATCRILQTAGDAVQGVVDTVQGFDATVRGGISEIRNIIFDKALSISRETVDFIAQHKVGACVAGAAGVAAIGSGMYAYGKYKLGTAAAEASRRQLELEQAETEAQIQADLVLQQALRDVAISEAETEAQIQERLEMQEAWQDMRRALG